MPLSLMIGLVWKGVSLTWQGQKAKNGEEREGRCSVAQEEVPDLQQHKTDQTVSG